MSLRALRTASLVGLCLAAALLISNPGPSEASFGLKGSGDRKFAPDFTLEDSRGADVKLSDYKGKVVVLNFWATWCGPCKVEIPWFVDFEHKYAGSGFAVLGISMDEEGWKSVRPYIEQSGITYKVMIGNEALAAEYGGLESIPKTLVIDREGRIAAQHVGLTSKSNYEEEIAQLVRR